MVELNEKEDEVFRSLSDCSKRAFESAHIHLRMLKQLKQLEGTSVKPSFFFE